MELADLKKHIRLARDEPVQIAFGLNEKGVAVVEMHRHTPGKTLEKQLKKEQPGLANPRWGTAVVDQRDAKLLRVTINKPGSGLARKLVVALKGSGCSKVKISLDDGTEVEADADADDGK